MKRSIKTSQLLLLLSYVTFIAHSLAEQPEGVKDEFIAHRQRHREARHLAGVGPNLQSGPVVQLDDNSAGQSPNWAGAVQTPPPSGSFDSVSAQWTLPTVSLPPSANGYGTWYTEVWVGIDGSSCRSAILQAGTVSYIQVSKSGIVTTGAGFWYEWYPDPEIFISLSDFPVVAGDLVEVSVQATSSTTGTATLNNLSTGQSETISLNAPTDADYLCGADAEWIVEDFSRGGKYVPFADFSTVSIQNCAATTTTGATVDLSTASFIDIVQSNEVLATATYVSSTELQVSYG